MATTKKAKSNSPDPSIFEGDYTIFALDSSLNRPGLCIYEKKNGKISVRTSNIESDKTKPHGYRLRMIYEWLRAEHSLVKTTPIIFVREHAFNSRGAQYEIGIFEAVGISNMFLSDVSAQEDWYEIYPVSVKKWITGEGKADKKKVEEALKPYLGERKYECDDESDAAAIALTFLMMNGEIEKKEC